MRGSIVGTRLDLAESLVFAAEGKVKAHSQTDSLASINTVLTNGTINGRVVLNITR